MLIAVSANAMVTTAVVVAVAKTVSVIKVLSIGPLFNALASVFIPDEAILLKGVSVRWSVGPWVLVIF